MEQDYLIGGHRIRVEGEKLVGAVAALSGFEVFGTKSKGEPVGRFVASAEEPPLLEKVLYTNVSEGVLSSFGVYRDGYVFSMTSPHRESLTLWMSKGGGVAYFTGNFEPLLLRLACWIAYGVLVNPYKTVAVHTSSILYDGKAVLFLGESGTGKSTHTRLWREHIKGATLLNDDSPIVRIAAGKAWVYGSPWSGKTPCYRNECYPLVGCVRLSQAPRNKISKLPVVQAYGALHPSCPPFFAYDDLYEPISDVLSFLLQEIPVCHLACLPDAAAARLSFETIFGVCGK